MTDTYHAKEKWHPITQLFHWGMFLILVGLFIVAYVMKDMEPSDQKWALYALHKATGFIVFILVFLRLGWRKISSRPGYPPAMPTWQRVLAESNIRILYVLLILMPLSGIIMSIFGGHDISVYNLFTIPALTKIEWISSSAYAAHGYISYAIYAFVALHIGAALYHHFVVKDNILKRMIPFSRID